MQRKWAKKVPTEPLTKPASVHNCSRTCGFTNGSFLTVTNSSFSLSSRSSHIVTIRMNSKGHILRTYCIYWKKVI
ncbi:unnamed protein product [Rhizophagus irregularis]|uniref:Uncharacterized protein n=1 Tax=Rhizophagus irregularis TaxID=588596 RepID=A0A916ECY2_9GLOM|nr:unnamed protein product [Rhizophagus irregularis]